MQDDRSMKARSRWARWLPCALLAAGASLFACSGGSSGGASPGDGGGGDTGSGSHDAGAGDSSTGQGHDGGASGPDAGTDATSSGGDAGDAGIVDAGPDTALPGWTLTWSDEFDGPDGSAVDPTKWKHDVGGSGWGNQELEYYTDGTQNAVVQGGTLVITATTEGASQYSCWYGGCTYTSARLLTQGLFSQAYGRFEARVQMPTGKGLWPAVWMLGDDIGDAGWPACGEIDFMETIGTDIGENHGSLHAPNYNPTATYPLPDGGSFADGFHVFAIEWEPGTVRFYVDDTLYETQTKAAVPSGGTWEFDSEPFFLLANVAVGGQWPGSPDGTTTFPQTMKVDWVRVYQKDGTEP
jgi:beta-glucanase (GH16 family)